jgi:hypothetical protein
MKTTPACVYSEDSERIAALTPTERKLYVIDVTSCTVLFTHEFDDLQSLDKIFFIRSLVAISSKGILYLVDERSECTRHELMTWDDYMFGSGAWCPRRQAALVIVNACVKEDWFAVNGFWVAKKGRA